ncbi:uncharacterized protein EDB91DRAFT_1088761 [Suillus paluster]|uniref:uncharacterized protein n=1 Tax=Suillus paluster TaxID=48578 RepID=UPI001B886522|nr:uncharacterized protein EDB91DRAFT_1088761 [Suillus paluster]KAG1720605.1 hypothetical protein EDB91DRAFT_1088761 [Suillus paluster]
METRVSVKSMLDTRRYLNSVILLKMKNMVMVIIFVVFLWVLPLSNWCTAAGIVESSMHRIKVIHLPPKDKARIKGDTAEMVEDELERIFVRVVMSQWASHSIFLLIPRYSGYARWRGLKAASGETHTIHIKTDTILVLEPAILNTSLLSLGLHSAFNPGPNAP